MGAFVIGNTLLQARLKPALMQATVTPVAVLLRALAALEQNTQEGSRFGMAAHASFRDFLEELQNLGSSFVRLGFLFLLEARLLALSSFLALATFTASPGIWRRGRLNMSIGLSFSVSFGSGLPRQGTQADSHLRHMHVPLCQGVQWRVCCGRDFQRSPGLLGDELPELSIGVEGLSDRDIPVARQAVGHELWIETNGHATSLAQ